MIEAPSLARPGAPDLVLASGSRTRATMLQNAGLDFDIAPAAIDEAAVKHSLIAEGASPHRVADTLAELKAANIAQKIGGERPGALVLGADQVLDLGRRHPRQAHRPGPPPPTICTASPASAITSSPPPCC